MINSSYKTSWCGSSFFLLLSWILAVLALSSCTSQTEKQMTQEAVPQQRPEGPLLPRPLVIAHRGSSGVWPEHTLESYLHAIEAGADFIEPDLVITKDGHLIARHENELSDTTDVAEKFPNRRTRKTIDGRTLRGWFTEDFTLKEIKTLRARQRFSFRPQEHNNQFEIPTLEEILTLVQEQTQKTGRPIGVYPETKHPSYFRSIGLPLEARLLELLRKFELDHEKAWVLIQSFETENLKTLSKQTQVSLIQLIDRPRSRITGASEGPQTYGELLTPEGLKQVSLYARGIGIAKSAVTAELLENAHRAGLWVHVYTFRNEARYVGRRFRRDPLAEFIAYYKMGVDGVFADFPATALDARKRFTSDAGVDGENK